MAVFLCLINMRSVETDNRFLITLPRRGLQVVAPEHTRRVMSLAQAHKANRTRFTEDEKRELWPETEKARLWLMKRCSILEKRYPTAQDGQKFMGEVDYGRRAELLIAAGDFAEEVVLSWRNINPHKEIAVILFGSVAKGLVKGDGHPDPSNIDLAVMGDISPDERERLLDEIRPGRNRIKDWILERTPFVNSSEKNPGNVGVFVQHTDKLTGNDFGLAKNYIKSGAITLYDPSRIWAEIEMQALQSAAAKMTLQRKHNRFGNGIVFQR